MELAVQSKPSFFLRNILREVRFQEETGEIIVPDSYPDIGRISDCTADAILRGKDCRDGCVSVAGGIKGVLIFTPDDHTCPRTLEIYLPFTVKFEHPSLSANTQVVCTVRVRSVDGRMINSRKAMIRVNLGCECSAFEPAEDVRYEFHEMMPQIQTKPAEYTTEMVMETGEKSFVCNDTLEIPTGRPPVVKICSLQCQPELTNEKLVGSKAVFKGNIRCKLLYISENDRLYLHEQSLQFSQYCEMHEEYDEEKSRTTITVTGYDLDFQSGGEGIHIPVNINLLAQSVVYGMQTLQIVEDAYCTHGTFHPEWHSYNIEGCLDHQILNQSIRQRLNGNLKEIVDARMYWDQPMVEHHDSITKIKVPVQLKVLGYDDMGELQTVAGTAEAVQELALSDQAKCYAVASPVGETYAVIDGGSVEVRTTVAIVADCHSREELKTLCGGDWTPEEQAEDKRPSLIVRTVEKDTELWDLAKAYRTTVENIVDANHLETGRIMEDSVLLLPIS